MRVVHVISALDPLKGGPITALLGLAEAQKRQGLDVAIAATWVAGELDDAAKRLRALGIEVKLAGPATGPLRRHHDIFPALEELLGKCDVVHIHALYEEIQHQAARMARDRSLPYIFTPHGMLDPWSLAQSRLKKRLYMLWRLRKDLDHAAALHFTSAAESDGASALRLRPPRIVVPLGVDLSEFETLPPKGSFRAKHSIPQSRAVVMFLGRIHPGKGLELLVPAFANATRGGEAMLVIVGPDSENFRATVEADIARAGIGDRVLFTGMLRGGDRVAALRDADLFSLPSFHENFGLAVVEALACGVPVVITDEVNVHREITAAGVGAAVPTQVAPLTNELSRWLSDAAMRRAAAEKARDFVWQNYDWDKIARRWVDEYAAVTRRS